MASNSMVGAIQQNMIARSQLLTGAPRLVKKTASGQGTAGQSTRIKLSNVGILTKLRLYITANLTIGVAVATPSAKAPYNLISRIRVTDYDNTDHVNCSGWQLFLINSVRKVQIYGVNNYSTTTVFTNPSIPTAIGAGVLSFAMEVPLAFDVDNKIVQLQDLRGAIFSQTSVGDMYLTIDWITSLYTNGDVDALYSGGATTTVAGTTTTNYINVDVYQHFIGPQSENLPVLDLNTVYELNGNVRSSDNIAVNSEKQIAVPNTRAIIGAYFTYVQATTMTTGKIGTLRLIANSNAELMNESEFMRLLHMRELIGGGDVPAGNYFYKFLERPIETALYGNMFFGITPTVVGATPYFEIAYESFFTKGVAMSAIAQGS